jgi:hypothetical protein
MSSLESQRNLVFFAQFGILFCTWLAFVLSPIAGLEAAPTGALRSLPGD